MRNRTLLVAGLVGVVGLAFGVGLLRSGQDDRTPVTQPAAAGLAAPVPPPRPIAEATVEAPVQDALDPSSRATPDASHPAVRRHLAHRAFEAELRAFFAEAASMTPDARIATADALMRSVIEREHSGALLPPEALALRIALLRARSAGDDGWRAEADALTAQYRAEGEARERAGREAVTSDPRFVAYKLREAEIVREVMALPPAIDGRPRDAVLQERLDEARRAAWGPTGVAAGR